VTTALTGRRWIDESLPVPIMDETEVYAGRRVSLRWRSLEGQAEELELVFSLDDGRTFNVRVSPELSGGECRYEWRVPNVGVQRARMRLRARKAGHELSGPAGRPFRIVPSPVKSPERWTYRDGEWWEDRSGVPFALPGLVTPPHGPSLQANDDALAAAVPQRTAGPTPYVRSIAPAFAVAVEAAERPTALPAAPQAHYPMRE
jgi:hypothetical protein